MGALVAISFTIICGNPAVFTVLLVHDFITFIISWYHEHNYLIWKLLLTLTQPYLENTACLILMIMYWNLKERNYGQIADLHKFNISWKNNSAKSSQPLTVETTIMPNIRYSLFRVRRPSHPRADRFNGNRIRRDRFHGSHFSDTPGLRWAQAYWLFTHRGPAVTTGRLLPVTVAKFKMAAVSPWLYTRGTRRCRRTWTHAGSAKRNAQKQRRLTWCRELVVVNDSRLFGRTSTTPVDIFCSPSLYVYICMYDGLSTALWSFI